MDMRVHEAGGLQRLRPRKWGGGLGDLAAMSHGSASAAVALEDLEDSRTPNGEGIVWA
jgi:hypothetical protein